MHRSTWLRSVSRWVLYPLLGAAYPVVFLYAQNVHQGVTAGEVLGPLGLSVGAALLLLAVLSALIRDAARAGLITTVLVALFFTYGLAWDQYGYLFIGQWVVVTLWLVAALVSGVLIARFGGAARRLTVPLNAFAAVLLL